VDLGLKGKVVLITGGSKGLGLASARGFLQEAARVVIVSRNPANIAEARDTLAKEGHELLGEAADLGSSVAAEYVVSKVEREIGPIDVLVNSAGAAKRRPADELDAASWKAAMDAKFFPYVYAQDAVLRRMRARAIKRGQTGAASPEQEIGAIVNIVGIGGRIPTESHIAGSSANAALLLSTIGLAQHFAHYGIRINAVNPGQILTGRIDQAVEIDARRLGLDKAAVLERAQNATPLRRFGRPEEVADIVVFLASRRASYMVGSLVSVDGGQKVAI